jgi:hypothetical protein
MTTSAAVRQKLVEALSLDLVGPDATADDHYQDEIISQAPRMVSDRIFGAL